MYSQKGILKSLRLVLILKSITYMWGRTCKSQQTLVRAPPPLLAHETANLPTALLDECQPSEQVQEQARAHEHLIHISFMLTRSTCKRCLRPALPWASSTRSLHRCHKSGRLWCLWTVGVVVSRTASGPWYVYILQWTTNGWGKDTEASDN